MTYEPMVIETLSESFTNPRSSDGVMMSCSVQMTLSTLTALDRRDVQKMYRGAQPILEKHMAIRITREAWAVIRSEYEAGATAAELLEKYKSVKPTTIHARACREKWRETAVQRSNKPSPFAVMRAKKDGITIEDAIDLENAAQATLLMYHREQVLELDGIVAAGIGHLELAMNSGDKELIAKCSSLSLIIKEMTFSLSEKLRIERALYGLNFREA